MSKVAFEAVLLLIGAILYNGMLYGKIITGEYRFKIHQNIYIGGLGDFVIEVILGAIMGLFTLALVRRLSGWRFFSFLLASLTALYFGMPDAQLFGATWARWEQTNELFLQKLDLIIPIVLATTAVYAVYLWSESKLSNAHS